MNALPGYFGKVVTHGDFVQRRLPLDFVGAWDRWLQNGLCHSRVALGTAWLEIYLNSPVWRFATAAGVCGVHAMAGVLVPSVDRVGRYFPWTLAAPVAAARAGSGAAALPWYDTLQSLALRCVGPDFVLEAVDGALAALGAFPGEGAGAEAGRSRFWSDVTVSGVPVSRSFAGLPAVEDFAALLAGVA